MIFGIGTDIIEVNRIAIKIEKEESLKETLFTSKEITYCEKLISKNQNYAARFAAKEAFFKALGTGWREGMAYKEIEIINNKLGKPEIFLHGKVKEYADKLSLKNIHLSISHIKEIANALVIIEI